MSSHTDYTCDGCGKSNPPNMQSGYNDGGHWHTCASCWSRMRAALRNPPPAPTPAEIEAACAPLREQIAKVTADNVERISTAHWYESLAEKRAAELARCTADLQVANNAYEAATALAQQNAEFAREVMRMVGKKSRARNKERLATIAMMVGIGPLEPATGRETGKPDRRSESRGLPRRLDDKRKIALEQRGFGHEWSTGNDGTPETR